MLRYWLDLPLDEVAAVMGVRLGTAKSEVSRGLAALRRLGAMQTWHGDLDSDGRRES